MGSERRPQGMTWPLRLISSVLGALTAVVGFYGYAHGRLWSVGYNAMTGTFGVMPSLTFAALGCIVLVIGLVPWNRIK